MWCSYHYTKLLKLENSIWGFLGNARGEGNGTPLQYSCLENPMDRRAWWAAVHGVAKSRTWLSDFTFTFHFHALEKAMAAHSGVLAWRIPGMGEPGGLTSMGSHRVRHNWSDLATLQQQAVLEGREPDCQYRRGKRCRFNPWLRKIPWRREWQPTPVFLPGESHEQRSLAGYSP